MPTKYSLPSTEEMVRMYMHGSQIEETLAAIRKTQEYLTAGPNARTRSVKFLQDLGIYDSHGRLTPPYRTPAQAPSRSKK